ncbi:MAG: helix-turn-helix domain-containing protein [Gemmatimonadota bacterium]
MPATRLRPGPAKRATIPAPVPFHTTKYGPELLVDVATVREMPSFIRQGPHQLAFYDIILVTEGRGTFSLDGLEYPVKPGTLLCTTPGQVREWDVPALDGVCLFFPALFLEEFFNDSGFLHRLPFFHAPAGAAAVALSKSEATRWQQQLLAMRQELRRLRRDSAHLLRAQVYALLVTLARHIIPDGTAASAGSNSTVTRFLEMVHHDVATHRQVAEFSRHLGVSPGYLNTLCRNHLGRGAKAVIADRVMVEARRLLRYSDLTAQQIALRLGFHDASYFSRFFRLQCGRSPRDFRAEHAGRTG